MAKKEAKEKVVKQVLEKAPKKEAKPKKEKSIEETLWCCYWARSPLLV